MYAIVEDGSISKLITNPKSLVIGDVRYPAKIFSVWSASELNAIGIYEVIFDNSNKKDGEYYNNTNQSFDYADGEVTASYGIATPKELDDVTDEDGFVTTGLKTQKKKNVKQEALELLTPTDWYVLKAIDVESYSVPNNVSTYRTNVRTKSNEMETAINNASDVDALKALYQYVNTGTENNPVMERPLGEFPRLES